MNEQNKNERLIEKEKIYFDKEIIDQSENKSPDNKKNHKGLIIIILVILILIGGVVVFLTMNGLENENTNNVVIPPENSPANINEEGNLNINTNNTPLANILANEKITLTGRVFIKAYDTPSESYGLISTDGNEIGFGAYDSMREQFRPYVNENVTVNFSKVCKSTADDCCKSVFFYCGTVDTWEPIEEAE